MRGFVLFFDNQFLRLLMAPPKDRAGEIWQHFYFEKLNKEFIPFTILTTPFKFLEVLGIRPKERALEKYPFKSSDELLDNDALAEAIHRRAEEIVDRGIDFYSHVPELRSSHFWQRIDYMLQNEVGKGEYHQFLAEDIMVRFSKLEDVENQIWAYLAIDDLQAVLLRVGQSRLFQLAQLQTFRDLLAMFSDGFNISCFRLMRSMWCSIEGQLLNRGYKSIVPLKKITDLADVDYVHYATLGGYHREILRTMTVFTCDSYSQVETRLKIAKQLFFLFGHEILAKSLDQSAGGIPRYRHGRVFVCDPIAPTCQVISVKKLASNYQLPEGAINEAMMKGMSQGSEEDDDNTKQVANS